jgi:hypothetical protein
LSSSTTKTCGFDAGLFTLQLCHPRLNLR